LIRGLIYSYKLSEEIVRWALEVHLKNDKVARKNWFIAFTNPTAGPWKRVTAVDEEGDMVEILRFKREDDRPDLILVNDDLKVILIIEAKDSVTALLTSAQMSKSVAVIATVTQGLRESKSVAWRSRLAYEVLPGFLWGGPSPKEEFMLVEKAFQTAARKTGMKSPIGFAIRSDRRPLVPVVLGNSGNSAQTERLRQSLNL
jgi:hypothetical protein